ncbi:MAG: acyl-CoA thioesterase [Candidatus Andeanibacterium colombiense]|uniref:Acyl-CoA thioesterase n=1 Tax=Candidatus Andeanibacterium colombiense TaxID=3121345 RepID=A0AAJ5X628_9SPHN|nr:MAG: acyl-CoA thioesterase [Sphingomonadaceae bacterium]
MSSSYTMVFTAGPEHIDFNGHVNNMVWLQWVQDIATAHWEAVAPRDQQAQYAWWVSRHEIDYRGNIAEGDTVTARTFIPDPPQGARFLRCVDFTNAEGKAIVQVRSMWVMIDRNSGRPLRITAEVSGPFLQA